jgi:hypothetical protein
MTADAALNDEREPKAARLNQHKHGKPRERKLAGIQVRFRYEGGLAGEWFSVADALELNVTPNDGYRVTAIQFREVPDV